MSSKSQRRAVVYAAAFLSLLFALHVAPQLWPVISVVLLLLLAACAIGTAHRLGRGGQPHARIRVSVATIQRFSDAIGKIRLNPFWLYLAGAAVLGTAVIEVICYEFPDARRGDVVLVAIVAGISLILLQVIFVAPARCRAAMRHRAISPIVAAFVATSESVCLLDTLLGHWCVEGYSGRLFFVRSWDPTIIAPLVLCAWIIIFIPSGSGSAVGRIATYITFLAELSAANIIAISVRESVYHQFKSFGWKYVAAASGSAVIGVAVASYWILGTAILLGGRNRAKEVRGTNRAIAQPESSSNIVSVHDLLSASGR